MPQVAEISAEQHLNASLPQPPQEDADRPPLPQPAAAPDSDSESDEPPPMCASSSSEDEDMGEAINTHQVCSCLYLLQVCHFRSTDGLLVAGPLAQRKR